MGDLDLNIENIYYALSSINISKEKVTQLSSILESVDINGLKLDNSGLLVNAKAIVKKILNETLNNIGNKLENTKKLIVDSDINAELTFAFLNGEFNDEFGNYDEQKVNEYITKKESEFLVEAQKKAEQEHYEKLRTNSNYRYEVALKTILSDYGYESLESFDIQREKILTTVRELQIQKNELVFSDAQVTLKFFEVINNKYNGICSSFSFVANNETLIYKYVDQYGLENFSWSLTDVPKQYRNNVECLSYSDMCGDSDFYRDVKDGLEDNWFLAFNSKINKVNKNVQEQLVVDNAKLEELNNSLIVKREELSKLDYTRENIVNNAKHISEDVWKYTLNEDFSQKCNNVYGSDISTIVSNIKNTRISSSSNPDSFVNYNYTYLMNQEEEMQVIYSLIADTGEFFSGGGDVSYVDKFGKLVYIKSNDDMFSNMSLWASKMSSQQKEIFYYNWNTGGYKAAYEYLVNISDELNNEYVYQRTVEDQKFASENHGLASVASVLLGPGEGLKSLEYSVKQLLNKDKMYSSQLYSIGDTMRAQVSTDIATNPNDKYAGAKSFMYNVGMSIADNLYSVALSGGNSISSGIFLGVGGFDNNMNDALSRGLTDIEAFKYSSSMSVVEGVTEAISIDNLLNLKLIKNADDVIKNAGKFLNASEDAVTSTLKSTNKVIDGLKTVNNFTDDTFNKIVLHLDDIADPKYRKLVYKGTNLLYGVTKQGTGEGMEELASSILGEWVDKRIAGENSAFNISVENYKKLGYSEAEAISLTQQQQIEEFTMSYLSGLTSGSITGGGKLASSMLANDVSSYVGNMIDKYNNPNYDASNAFISEQISARKFEDAIDFIMNQEGKTIDEKALYANSIINVLSNDENRIISNNMQQKLTDIIQNYVALDNIKKGDFVFNDSVDNIKTKLSNVSYDKVKVPEYIVSYLKSNIRKYLYKDTNAIDGLNEQIMENGLYHFTTAADAIIESGYIKPSGYNASYGNKKTFFFNGIPDVGAFATNLDSIPVKTTALKVKPSLDVVNDSKLKLRYADDMAISYDGQFDLKNMEVEKCYFGLVVENGQFVYKQISEEVYNVYEKTNMGKILSNYISSKDVVSSVKGSFLADIVNRNSKTGENIQEIFDNNNYVIDPVHGFQLGDSSFGDFFKAKIVSGFFTFEQVKLMLDRVNSKGFISENAGKYYSQLFSEGEYDIYVKTVHSSDVSSIMSEGIRCLGSSTSGYGGAPTSVSDINLSNTVTKVDGTYDLFSTLKSANGVSQGMNPIDGTVIIKVPKGIDTNDIFYFNESTNTYNIKPEYVDSFSAVDNNGVVSEPIFNEIDTEELINEVEYDSKQQEYSLFSLQQIKEEYSNYQELCDLFLSIADVKIKEKLEQILYFGGYNGYSLNSGHSSKDNPSIEMQRRISMAELLIKNPATFDRIVEKNVNLFHGTNSRALASILSSGLNNYDSLTSQGISVSTGETWSRGSGRDFTSFTDILGVAEQYSLGYLDDSSFDVVIGTTVEDAKKGRIIAVGSDIPEVAIKKGLPVENIKVLLVPSDKIELVKGMVNNNVEVLPLDLKEQEFFAFDTMSNELVINYDGFNDFQQRRTIDDLKRYNFVNETGIKFLISKKIDAFGILNLGDLAEVKTPNELNELVSNYGMYHRYEDTMVSVGDILGSDYSFSNILFSLSQYFDKYGSGYEKRSVSLLEQYDNGAEMLLGLEQSFIREKIDIKEVLPGEYVIANNGLHRYTALRIHYLNELLKAGSDIDRSELKEKYMIPVHAKKIDYVKTYSNFILRRLDRNVEDICSNYTRNNEGCSVQTDLLDIIYKDGTVVTLNDEQLIVLVRDLLVKSMDDKKNPDYFGWDSECDYKFGDWRVEEFYNSDVSFKNFVDKIIN